MSSSYKKLVIRIKPTVPHCHLTQQIGLTIQYKLMMELPNFNTYKLKIFCFENSHLQKEEVEKQINDKERMIIFIDILVKQPSNIIEQVKFAQQNYIYFMSRDAHIIKIYFLPVLKTIMGATCGTDSNMSATNMLYVPTIKSCHYHPGTPLQNFCTNPACSLPLCPKCIKPHLQDKTHEHNILSLEEVIRIAQEQTNKYVGQLEEQSITLDKNYGTEPMLAHFRTQIEDHRSQTLKEVNEYYNSIEKEVRTQLQVLHDQHIKRAKKTIDDKLGVLKKWMETLEDENKMLGGIIVMNASNQVEEIKTVLESVKEYKGKFAEQIPELEPTFDGRLNISRLQDKGMRTSRVSSIYNPTAKKNIDDRLGAIEKMVQFEKKLQKTRYTKF